MRKLMRSMARNNMKKAKMEKLNKKEKNSRSIFARKWRDYVIPSKTIKAQKYRYGKAVM